MATLIPNMKWDELRKLSGVELKSLLMSGYLRACEVYDGDEGKAENYLFTLIPHNSFDTVVADNIRTKAEFLGMSTNSIYPPIEPQPESTQEQSLYGKRVAAMAHAREAKQRKHEKVGVTA